MTRILFMVNVRLRTVSHIFSGLLRDAAYAVRVFRRQPGFALTAIVTIAVGVGALASVLSLVRAVLLRPPPYPNAARIVQIEQVVKGRGRTEVSPLDMLALKRDVPSLSLATMAWFSDASVAGDGLPRRVLRVYTDADGFALLGTRPHLGRLPALADERPGAEPVVVLGHALWTDRFGADAGIIGKTLRVDGRPHTVIAVMPPEFRFPSPYWAAGDLWLLRGPSDSSWPQTRSPIFLAFGLLEPGRTIQHAQAEADVVARSLDARYPSESGSIGLRLTTWAERTRGEARSRLLLIASAAGLVFLIVCVNVANLLIGRGLDRHRELAARAALGAGHARLVRQLLTETAMLFIAGGAAGLVIAVWATRGLISLQSLAIPRMNEATIDAGVMLTSMAIAIAAAAVVGIIPAWQATHAGANGLTASDARGSGGRGTRGARRVQRVLVAAEVALALVLICNAGVLVEGARRLAAIDLGFDASGLLNTRVSLPPERYGNSSLQNAFYERALTALRETPGVSAAALTTVPPGGGGRNMPAVMVDGDPMPTSVQQMRRTDVRLVSDGYLESLGLTPVAGRFFSPTEAAPAAIVNEAFVRQHLGGQPPLGRHMRVALDGTLEALDTVPRIVIGVVRDIKEQTLYRPAPATIYLPMTQVGAARFPLMRMTLVVRGARPAQELEAAIRATLASVDPEMAPAAVTPLSELIQRDLSINRLNLRLLGVLAAAALFLAVVGVYGVTAQALRQRTHEFAIRLALGVAPAGISGLLLRETSALFPLSIAAGAVASVWSARLLRAAVSGIDATSPLTFVTAGLLLAAVVVAAGYLPARRAARIDPSALLRGD
jgi:putative ABC transport system permease protein